MKRPNAKIGELTVKRDGFGVGRLHVTTLMHRMGMAGGGLLKG